MPEQVTPKYFQPLETGNGGVLCPFNGSFRQPVVNDRHEYREKKYCLPVHMVIGSYMVHTRTGGAGFLKKKIKKIKKIL